MYSLTWCCNHGLSQKYNSASQTQTLVTLCHACCLQKWALPFLFGVNQYRYADFAPNMTSSLIRSNANISKFSAEVRPKTYLCLKVSYSRLTASPTQSLFTECKLLLIDFKVLSIIGGGKKDSLMIISSKTKYFHANRKYC